MVQTLQAIKGGGGSVKVGTVGTISSLMTRELDTSSTSSRASSSSDTHSNGPLKPRPSMEEANGSALSITTKPRSPEDVRRKSGQNQHRVTVTSASATTPKRQKQKAPLEDMGNNTVKKGTARRSPDTPGKTRSQKRSSYRIPMLQSENIHLENTPIRDKPTRKGATNIVDIVDVNCGNAGGSLSNRLKKLNFSKLSHSFM